MPRTGARLMAAVLALLPLLPHAALAQAQPSNEMALDVSYLGATVSYARRTGERSLRGVLLGAGGLWRASEYFGADHFNEGDLTGFAHGGAFLRREYGEILHVDAGVQLGLMLHSDDTIGAGSALALAGGPFLNPMIGWGDIRFGPRIAAAFVVEGSDANAFGLIVDPLTARVSLRF